MSPLSVPELLAIRENQVLRNALSLCEDPPARRPVRVAAFEIVALNLILHGTWSIARKLTDAGGRPDAGPRRHRGRTRQARGARPGRPGRPTKGRRKSSACPGFSSANSSARCCRSMRVLACPARPSSSRLSATMRLNGRPRTGFPSYTPMNGVMESIPIEL